MARHIGCQVLHLACNAYMPAVQRAPPIKIYKLQSLLHRIEVAHVTLLAVALWWHHLHTWHLSEYQNTGFTSAKPITIPWHTYDCPECNSSQILTFSAGFQFINTHSQARLDTKIGKVSIAIILSKQSQTSKRIIIAPQ